jgi:hypothetical protein
VIEKNGFFFMGLVGNENFVFLFFVSGVDWYLNQNWIQLFV